MSYQDAIAEAYASAPLDDLIIDTIELYHPSFRDDNGNPTAIRVCRTFEDWELKLEAEAILNGGQYVKFLACEFDFAQPEFAEDSVPQIPVTIGNVSREITRYLEQAQYSTSPIILTWRPYLASDRSMPQIDPPIVMELTDVDVDVFSATGTATLEDVHNSQFPSEVYTYNRFPGLRR